MTKRHIALALKFVVSGGLIWFLIDGVDLGAARDRILGADHDPYFMTSPLLSEGL